MSAFIQLTKENHQNRPAPALVVSDRPIDVTTDTDDVGENEGAALAVVESEQPRPVEQPATEPCVIAVSAIRCFYQRRRSKGHGTRITFTDGGGFVVTESYDDVLTKIRSVTDAVA